MSGELFRSSPPGTHTIHVPAWHPARLNELLAGHWARRNRLKRHDGEVLALFSRLSGIPKATGKRRVSLVLTLAPRQRAGDPDGHWKSVLDALVAAGMLVNDSHVWCELGPVTFERGKGKATTIILEDLPREGAGQAAAPADARENLPATGAGARTPPPRACR
jgi:hypothetical protein